MRVGPIALSLGLMIGLLTGCATFHKRPISAQHSLSTFDARRLDSATTHRAVTASLKHGVGPWPPRRWDLRLLTPVALHYSTKLDIAQAQARVARANVGVAREYPNPQFAFTPGYKSGAQGGLSPWIFTYVLSFPIPTAGRRRAAIHEAGRLSVARQFDVATVAWQVRSRLRRRLLDLYIAAQRTRLLRREAVAAQKIVCLLRARRAAGDIGEPALLEGESAYRSIEYHLAQAHASRRLARQALAAALGLPARALQDIALDFKEFRSPLPRAPALAVQRAALINLPRIQAALARYAASQYALQREIARQYPTLTLGPGYEWDQGQNLWSLGIGISLPVFNHNEGGVAHARARRQELAARFREVQERVISTVGETRTAYRSARRRLALAIEAARTAGAAARALSQQFEAGEVSELAFLYGRQAAVQSALTALDAEYATQQAAGALEDAVEQPLNAADRRAQSHQEEKRP